MSYLLGVDIGSSACKAAIVSKEGDRTAAAVVPYRTYCPQPGWREQDPEDWYRAAAEATRSCLRKTAIKPSELMGLALTGPAHNVVLLDGGGAALGRMIHWSDTRTLQQTDRLIREHGDEIFETTFQRMSLASTLSHLLWIRENQRKTWESVRHILVTKDWLRYRLTGGYATDPHDAAGTQLYDVRREHWAEELCRLVGLDLSVLPEIKPAAFAPGGLLPEPAADLGLNPGTPVAIGSADTAIEAFSLGAVEPGDCVLKLGTSGNVNIIRPGGDPSPICMTYPYLASGLWIAIAATSSGAGTLKWYVESFCRDITDAAEGPDPYSPIFRMAEEIVPGCQGLIFHPYLLGERSPYWDPHLRGAFHGIRSLHDRRHFLRAVMEGVAYSLRDCLEASQAGNGRAKRIWLLGGRVGSSLWGQMVSDVLGTDLRAPQVSDAAYGCAILAGLACGEIDSPEAILEKRKSEEAAIRPLKASSAVYAEGFALYRRTAEAVAGFGRRLDGLTVDGEPGGEEISGWDNPAGRSGN